MVRCILVVDDSGDVRRVVGYALREAGYSVVEAEDGVAALQFLERGGVDIHLVLSDISMPRMDGIELGCRIVEGGWTCPVLYMTGDASALLVGDQAGKPALPLLQKPFSMSTLVEVVDRLLRPLPTLQWSPPGPGNHAGFGTAPGILRA